MRKIIICFTVISVYLSAGVANAQDIIVKNDGEIIKAKVVEIGETSIRYKNYSNQEGPTYSINISNVLSLTYENGSKETFSNISVEKVDTENINSSSSVTNAVLLSEIASLESKKKTANIICGVTTGIAAAGAIIGGIFTGGTALIIVGAVVPGVGGVISGLISNNYNSQIRTLESQMKD